MRESSIGKIKNQLRNGLGGFELLHRMCIQGLHSQKLALCALDFDNFSTNYWRSLLTRAAASIRVLGYSRI